MLSASQTRSAAAEIVEKIVQAAHRLRGVLAGHFAGLGLSDVRYAVLRIIRDAAPDGCAQTTLAERLGQSESSISALIGRMRNGGLIYRIRSQQDRRQWRLILSDKGRQTLVKAEEHHDRRVTALLEDFSPSELQTLSSLLAKLLERLTQVRGGEQEATAAPQASAESVPFERRPVSRAG